MMRVVIDTNVVISGIFWKGTPNKILKAWFKDKYVALISPGILEEYEKVIKRMESGLTPEEIQRWIEIIISHSTTIEAPLIHHTGLARNLLPKSSPLLLPATVYFFLTGIKPENTRFRYPVIFLPL